MIGIISVLWSGSREYGMHDLLEEMKAFQQEIVKKLPINKLCGIYSEGNEYLASFPPPFNRSSVDLQCCASFRRIQDR